MMRNIFLNAWRFMSADATGEPHFHAEVYRVHNNFLHVGLGKKMENLLFRSVYFLILIFIFRKPHYK
jgi:hypothetical protein